MDEMVRARPRGVVTGDAKRLVEQYFDIEQRFPARGMPESAPHVACQSKDASVSSLNVGGLTIDRQAAFEHAQTYLTRGTGWSYPSYDGFDATRSTGPLNDADLLAPVLLNVGRTYSIELYEALQAASARLNTLIDQIPVSARLAEATEDELTIIGDLFASLDGAGIRGARGTVLAKVLHRKRPGFIPLYDNQVHRVYVGPKPFPIQRARTRSWREFMIEFSRAVRDDLQAEADFWSQVVALAVDPPITDLRALDIVAWWAGRP